RRMHRSEPRTAGCPRVARIGGLRWRAGGGWDERSPGGRGWRRRMSDAAVIAFGQQPCGFFPRRFLVAKIRTARRLRDELGGRIVFFCHDSDHDPRETRTILRHRKTGETAALNFAVGGKLQRKFSPLYAKRIAPDWQARTLLQLPNYVD